MMTEPDHLVLFENATIPIETQVKMVLKWKMSKRGILEKRSSAYTGSAPRTEVMGLHASSFS